MAQPAIKKRFDRCKLKTLHNLLKVYRCVYPYQEPFHYHCYDKNGHKFVRVEINDFLEVTEEQLVEIKKPLPNNTFIQVHFFERHAQDPKLIDI